MSAPSGPDFGGLLDVLTKDRPAPTIARESGAWAFVPDEATQALEDRIVGVAGNGAPLGDLFDSFGADAAASAQAALMTAMSTGTNPLMVAQLLAGILGVPEARAETIARTELVGAYRDAQLANYRVNDDVVRSWMWSAGPGCCVACMFMDGSVHPLYESMDSHANCRCSPIPVTYPWSDILAPLGIDASDIPETSIEASYVPMAVRFLQMSPAEQLAILGPAKYAAWAQGDIHLDDLVGVRDAGAWGKQVYERSLKELGLNARDYLPVRGGPGPLSELSRVAHAGPERFSELPEGPPRVVTRTGTYPDGRQWTVREYRGAKPPAEETSAYASLGRDDGAKWTPNWSRSGDDGPWYDVTPHMNAAIDPETGALMDNQQCLNCYRVYDGPLEGEYPDHIMLGADETGSHAYCPECDATQAAAKDFWTTYFQARNPEASADEIAQMVDAQSRKALIEPGPERPSALPGGAGKFADQPPVPEPKQWPSQADFEKAERSGKPFRGLEEAGTAPSYEWKSGGQRYFVKQAEANSSATAYAVGRVDGSARFVVPVREYNISGGYAYEVQPWIAGKSLSGMSQAEAETFIANLGENDRWQLLLHDYVVDNYDMHAGNFLIDQSGALRRIDEGDAFFGSGRAKQDTWQRQFTAQLDNPRAQNRMATLLSGVKDSTPIPREVINNFVANRQSILDAARGSLVSWRQDELPKLEQRLDALARLSKIPNPTAGDLRAILEGRAPEIERASALPDAFAQRVSATPGPERPSALRGGPGGVARAPAVTQDAQDLAHSLQAKPIAEYAARHHMSVVDFTRAVTEHLQELVDQANVSIRLGPKALAAALDDGKITALSEERLGNRSLDYLGQRHAFEEEVWGLPRGAPDVIRPVSGYLAPRGTDDPSVAAFGDIRVVLKDTVRERTTLTFGDSLDNFRGAGGVVGVDGASVPRALDQVQADSFRWLSPTKYVEHAGDDPLNLHTLADFYHQDGKSGYDFARYVEAQIHGGVSLGDIKEVVFTGGSIPSPVLRDALDARGISWRVEGETREMSSALPGNFHERVSATLGRDTATEWADALGEHGQLGGPIAEREEALAWEPKATSADVSDALSEQLGVHVNLDELHPAAANQFAQALQVLQRDFPEVFEQEIEYIGQTGRDYSAHVPDSTLGRSRTRLAASTGDSIGFNRYFWSAAKTDLADLTALLQDQVETGWFFDGAGSPAATLAHEFGHSLQWWAENVTDNAEVRQLVGDFVAKWNARFNDLSAYAMTESHEAFAEAFAATYFGSAEVLADPMVEDMSRLLGDIRDALDGAGAPAVERAAAEDVAKATQQEMETRLRELPEGTSASGPTRMRYEEWRMTREDEPIVMVFDANRNPLVADTWRGVRETQLTEDQQAAIDTVRARAGRANEPLKVAIWKPAGDGLTPAELRWSIDQGANEIHVLTPNGVDILRMPRGPRMGAWTPQWVRETVMPLVKGAQSDAYHELLAEEMGNRLELPPAERTPRTNDYDRMELRIQAKLPQRVWAKVADQVPGLEYEHLPLPKQGGALGEIPRGWEPPRPLLPEKDAADVERFAELPQDNLSRLQAHLADEQAALDSAQKAFSDYLDRFKGSPEQQAQRNALQAEFSRSQQAFKAHMDSLRAAAGTDLVPLDDKARALDHAYRDAAAQLRDFTATLDPRQTAEGAKLLRELQTRAWDVDLRQSEISSAQGGRGAIVHFGQAELHNPAAEQQAFEMASQRIFGRVLTRDEIAGMVGAPRDSYVMVGSYPFGDPAISFTINGPSWDIGTEVPHGLQTDIEYHAERTLTYDARTGQATMENHLFTIRDDLQGSGLGRQVFVDEVDQLTQLGVRRITTEGAGNVGGDKSWNGYYTWPRFGYNGRIPADPLDILREMARAGRVPREWGNYTTVQQLMRTPEGRAWWKEWGENIDLEFDLRPDSYSHRILDAYLRERGVR